MSNTQTFDILLVEDNSADIYLFQQALKGAGLDFHLTVIVDGLEALAFAERDGKYAERQMPDLAVLDLNLPKVGGLEVLKAFRRNQDFERMPVFVLTSSAEPREQAMEMELHIEKFITKPSDLEEFLQIGYAVKGFLEKTVRMPG